MIFLFLHPVIPFLRSEFRIVITIFSFFMSADILIFLKGREEELFYKYTNIFSNLDRENPLILSFKQISAF